jgi:arsenate reductase
MKVLILCTGNSCRSIIGEALVNKYLASKGIEACSAGSHPSGCVNPDARKALEEEGAWDDRYHSKTIGEAMKAGPFDLVVTVCDNAKESCPVFPGDVKTIHVAFEDPDGKPYEAFIATRNLIKQHLLPMIETALKRSKALNP